MNPPRVGVAVLLAQLGAQATSQYAERVSALDFTPGQTGLLRLIAERPGMNQQTLASLLGVAPSKVVALVDDLESRNLVHRRRNTSDRRATALHLSTEGETAVAQLRTIAREHEAGVTAGLTEPERARLLELLEKIAAPPNPP